jgi:hypothetical protein
MSKLAVGLMAALIASTSLVGVASAQDRGRSRPRSVPPAAPCPAARR